jgi:HK97 gp10 family phage protein
MRVNSKNNRWRYFERRYIAELDAGIEDMADGMAAAMQDVAPVATGTFRASISVQRVGPITVIIFSDVEYAVFLEYGTVFMDAIPTFRPVYEQSRRESVAHLRARLARVA